MRDMARMTLAQLEKQLDKFVPKRPCTELARDFAYARKQLTAAEAAMAKESAAIARLRVHPSARVHWMDQTVSSRRVTAAVDAHARRHTAASRQFFDANDKLVHLRTVLKARGCKAEGLSGASAAARCPADIGKRKAPARLRAVRR